MARKPKKRRKPNLKDPNSKTWRIKADNEWKRVVLAPQVCAVTHQGPSQVQLHPHHLISRTNLRYRHDPMNGICLSANIHSLGTGVKICAEGDMRQVLNFEQWLKEHRAKQWEWWVLAKEDKRTRTETYEEAYRRLTDGC